MPTNSTRHFADAERILEDVQHRRRNLDNNLDAVIRQREEQDLYNLVDNIPATSRYQYEGICQMLGPFKLLQDALTDTEMHN